MEIKATLNKPYTDKQRIDFIVIQNHQLGYEIRETAEALQAWGYTEEEIQIKKNEERIKEINSKIEELKLESINELLYGNNKNIEIYKDIINGLEKTKEEIDL